MRPPHHSPLLFGALTSLLIFFQLLTCAGAQTPAASTPSPTANIQPYARGRIFSVSTTSPISRINSRDPELIETTASLIDYFEATAEAVANALAVNHAHRAQRASNRTIPICNNRSIPWRSATINFVLHRGWPVNRDPRCITDIYGAGEVSNLSDENLASVIDRRALAQRGLRDDVIAELGLHNWTRSREWKDSIFEKGSQRCILYSASSVRVGGLWYIPTGITNRPQDEWLPSGERHYMVENMRVEGNRLVAALMTLPLNPVTGTEHEVETKSTTVLSRWGGAVEPSQFFPDLITDNSALEDALDEGQHFLQQVEDATTGSNIAILALPMVLSVIPFGLVTDITQKRMLVYALLSDIVTALPMFIKGVELVEISGRRFTSTVTRIGDMNVAENMTVVSEIWGASCGSDDNVATTGVSFIVLALLSMIAGIVLEVYVRTRQGSRNRKVGEYNVELEELDEETDEWISVSLEKQR